MSLLTLPFAALLVVGCPWLAMDQWASRCGITDPDDRRALSYGAIGLLAWGLWISTMLFGLSVAGVAGGVLLAVLVPVLASRWRIGGSAADGAPARILGNGNDGVGEADAESTGKRGDELGAQNAGGGSRGKGVDDEDIDGIPGRRPAAAAKLEARGSRALVGLAVASCLLTLIPFLVYGLERPDGVHRHAMTDWYKHLVVTTALDAGDAFPPDNPFLPAAGPAAYYYGFHLIASSIHRASGFAADPYLVLLALTLLNAAALPFVVALVAGRLCDRRGALAAAAAATLLTGFDLLVLGVDAVRQTLAAWPLPSGLAGLRAAVPATHIDYWIHHNERQLNSPFVTNLWAPQHQAAVLIALLVLYLLAPRRDDATHRPGAAEGAGPDRPPAAPAAAGSRRTLLVPMVLLAALPALSAYVAMGLAVGVAGAAALSVIAQRRPPWQIPRVRRWTPAAAGALLLSLPVVWRLAAQGGSSAGLRVHVSSAGDWANGALVSSIFGSNWWTRLLDTPAVLLFELGAVGIVAAWALARGLRSGNMSSTAREWALIVAVIVVVVTFVRPPTDGPNNLYARPMVLVFCLLAVIAATASHELWRSWLLRAAVGVCLLGTLYAVVGYVLEATLFWATPVERVELTQWIDRSTPLDDRVAIHPDDYDPSFGWWLRRRLVLADERHALLFGASRQRYQATAARLAEAYEAGGPEAAAAGFDALDAGLIVIARRGDSLPPWAAAPCFDVVFRNRSWWLLQRVPGACPTAASGRDALDNGRSPVFTERPGRP